MNDWSASNLERGIACPANYELQHSTWKPDGVKIAGYRGTVIHRFLEEVGIGVNYGLALDRVPKEYQELCSKIDVASIIPFGAEFEMAFIYRIKSKSSEYIGKGIKRNYGDLAFDEVPGTLDMAYVNNGVLHIRDFKTGKTPTESPPNNKQLLHLGICASDYFKVSKLDVGIIQINPDGTYDTKHGEADEWLVEEFKEKLNTTLKLRLVAKKKIEEKKKETLSSPELNEGEHCRYCPAKQFCPAKKTKKRKNKNV
jgi:hypothetical protein